MADPKPSKAEALLEHAMAQSAEAHLRYLTRAHAADLEGYPEVGAAFRDLARTHAEAGQTHLAHLARLRGAHDGVRMGDTEANVVQAIDEEHALARALQSRLAKEAETAGASEVASWLRALGERAAASAAALEARQGRLA